MPEMLVETIRTAPSNTNARSIEHIRTNTSSRGEDSYNSSGSDFKRLQVTSSDFNIFRQGSRDETLFRLANHLVKSGMPVETIEIYLRFFASHCDPPFPEKEIPVKIQSALNRKSKRENSISEDVRDFVVTSSGFFLTSDVFNRLQVTSRQEKKAATLELLRLHKKGVIERHGERNGCYRRIEHECEEMDFLNADTSAVDIWLPFGLNQMAETMPGNIIVLAGSPNSGKTAFLLNTVRHNMNKFDVYYFNSEMGAGELRKRLEKFDGIPLSDWKFKPHERSDNFADVIRPGEGVINIIDFLELHENFYEVSKHLAAIHKKLNGAIAIVALQKNPGLDTGLGGIRSLEKPRLYLSMDNGVIKIVKAKNHGEHGNPTGKQYRFKLAGGCKFREQQGWH